MSTSHIQSILNQDAFNTYLLRDTDGTFYEPKYCMIKTKTFYYFIPFNSLQHLLACWVFLLRPGIFYYLGNKNWFLLFLENLLLLTIYTNSPLLIRQSLYVCASFCFTLNMLKKYDHFFSYSICRSVLIEHSNNISKMIQCISKSKPKFFCKTRWIPAQVREIFTLIYIKTVRVSVHCVHQTQLNFYFQSCLHYCPNIHETCLNATCVLLARLWNIVL